MDRVCPRACQPRGCGSSAALAEECRAHTDHRGPLLDRDLEIDKVCDIFTQINSRGIRLDVFDLVNALPLHGKAMLGGRG